MSTKNKSSLLISVHPMVILSISEFFNRMRVNYKTKRVFGGLVGEQHGEKIELFSIFEFLNKSKSDSDVDLDPEFLDKRRKISEQLYPNYDFIGFFSTNEVSDLPDSLDKKVFNSLEKQGVMSPITLVMCSDLMNKSDLPLKAYFYDKTTDKFIPLSIEIKTYESERICLDTIVKTGSAQLNESSLVQNVDTLKSALTILKENLKKVLELAKNPKFRNNEKFIGLIDNLMKNYPKSCGNTDLNNFLKSSIDDILIIANVSSSSIGTNFLKNIN